MKKKIRKRNEQRKTLTGAKIDAPLFPHTQCFTGLRLCSLCPLFLPLKTITLPCFSCPLLFFCHL